MPAHPMAVAVPPALPMKLRKAELLTPGKAAAAAGAVAGGGRARVLVTVTVLGSAGPLRFLVDEGETVAGLVRAALRCYAREGRMPLLGADPADFLLYTANGRSDGTSPPKKNLFLCRLVISGDRSSKLDLLFPRLADAFLIRICL